MPFADKRREVLAETKAGFGEWPHKYTPVLFLPSGRQLRMKRKFGCWRLAKDFAQIRLIALRRKYGLPVA